MNDGDLQSLQQQLAEMRRETRRNYRLLVFIAITVSILLFTPSLATSIGAWFEWALAHGGPFLAILSVIIGAAFVVSWFSGPRPSGIEETPRA